jgi:predicted Zn-dependent protease with MMP-like domain/predicted Zn-dependent protease
MTKQNGETDEKRLDEAWSALEDGDLETAREVAEALRGSEEHGLDALLLLAACAREEGDDASAIGLLKEAAKGDPEWATPELWLAEILAMNERTAAEALRHVRRAVDLAEEEDEFLDALVVKARLELDLDRRDDARETLEELPPGSVALPIEITLDAADLLLELDRPAEAKSRLEALLASEPDVSDAWHLLGLAHEAMGDEAGKRQAFARVRELDEADVPAEDERVPEDDIAAVAEQALEELPDRARALLRDVPVIIAELPSREDVATGVDPRLVGMFEGTPYPEAGHGVGGGGGVTRILLFRRNLERIAEDEDVLRDEIRTTLLHETGHFFGMDEAALARVGLD